MHLPRRLPLLEASKGVDERVKDLIMDPEGNEADGFFDALRLKYGKTVPLYRAVDKEEAEMVDKHGFKLHFGKNYKSFAKEPILYFQIGRSDYVDDNRSELYRVDVPVEFLESYAEADMDSPDTTDDDLREYGFEPDDMASEMRDIVCYFIWNGFKLDGMELLITDRSGEEDEDIFKEFKPVKVRT